MHHATIVWLSLMLSIFGCSTNDKSTPDEKIESDASDHNSNSNDEKSATASEEGDSDSDPDADSERENDDDSSQDAISNPEAESDSDEESDLDAESDSEAESTVDRDSESDLDAESDDESGSDSDTGTDEDTSLNEASDLDTDTNQNSEISTDTTDTTDQGELTDGVTIEENDAAFCGALGNVSTLRDGFQGPGYFDSEDLPRVGISWVIDATTSDEYKLRWRYASEAATSTQLRIAHQDYAQVTLEATDNAWQDHTVDVSLPMGITHVSLVAESELGLPDIDSFTVFGTEVAAASCLDYAPGAEIALSHPEFRDASVHDPSVIKTGDTYYVFGSHLAAAKTVDLMDWTQVAGDGVNENNPLFDNVVTELSEAFDWSTVVGLWAADVIQLKSNNQYLMYYNSCEGSSPLSAMGIASSENIEGPYTDDGIFLYSGGSGYDAYVLPNAIDPDTFYDNDGILRMVYGSYSGGIYIMDMDPETGFPLPNQDNGTHLLGGNHIPIEGPYIQYSPHTGYYYLFTSYGGLAAGDGYNIRAARATTPHGPYYDHADVDQSTVRNQPFDSSGIKMMGDHVWSGTNETHGYVSPGHNSAYYEAALDTYFLIFHARFPGRGNLHQIRVHPMYINIDGWPVAAPLRYAPLRSNAEIDAAAVGYVGLGEVPGTYQLINHGRDTSGTIKESVSVSLQSDQTVSGTQPGSWTFGGNNVFVMQIGGSAFRGVLSRQFNEYDEEFQVTFAGVGANGETLWGIRTGD